MGVVLFSHLPVRDYTVLWNHSVLQGNCGTYTANELCGFMGEIMMYDHLSVVLCSNYSHRIGSCTLLVVMVDWRMLAQQSRREQTQIGRMW